MWRSSYARAKPTEIGGYMAPNRPRVMGSPLEFVNDHKDIMSVIVKDIYPKD